MGALWQQVDRAALRSRIEAYLGGEPERQTWHSADDIALALHWTGSSKIFRDALNEIASRDAIRSCHGWRNVYSVNWTQARLFTAGDAPAPTRPETRSRI